MKKSLLLMLLLLSTGCADSSKNNTSNYNHHFNWGNGTSSSMKLLRTYTRYNTKLGRNEKCRDFEDKPNRNGSRDIVVLCQKNNNGEWYVAEKNTVGKNETFINREYLR